MVVGAVLANCAVGVATGLGIDVLKKIALGQQPEWVQNMFWNCLTGAVGGWIIKFLPPKVKQEIIVAAFKIMASLGPK
ncbi:MAG: hypothetical protein ACRDAX_09945 [Propionibacteriaceae bacterium]